MLNYEDPYQDYFNPEDISQWIAKSPTDLMKAMMPVINEKIQGISAIADAIKRIPDIDKVRGEHWQPEDSVYIFMEQIIDETLRINRILRTGVAYIYYFMEKQEKNDNLD